MRRFALFFVMFAVVFTFAGFANALTIQHMVNGGFETGTFTGWNVINSGSGNWAINNGTYNPSGPGGSLAPISGNFDVVTFQGGPGQHTLYQQTIIPTGVTSASLSWSDRIRNNARTFNDPRQEWRVMIRNLSGGLISEVFSTDPGDPLQQLGPNLRSFDLTTLAQSLVGQQIRISFEQRQEFYYFNTNLDDVSFTTTTTTVIPEPTTVSLFIVGLLGLVGHGWRRKRSA